MFGCFAEHLVSQKWKCDVNMDFADVMVCTAENGFVVQQISHTLQCKKVKLDHTKISEREKPLHSCGHLSPISKKADSALAVGYVFLLLQCIVGRDREITLSTSGQTGVR